MKTYCQGGDEIQRMGSEFSFNRYTQIYEAVCQVNLKNVFGSFMRFACV